MLQIWCHVKANIPVHIPKKTKLCLQHPLHLFRYCFFFPSSGEAELFVALTPDTLYPVNFASLQLAFRKQSSTRDVTIKHLDI